MGISYFVTLDDQEPDASTPMDGKALAQHADQLQQICDELGLPALEDFISYSAEEASVMMDDLDEEGFLELDLPEESWFRAEEGLEVVRALQHYLADQPDIVANPDQVLADLASMEKILLDAQSRGAQWKLQVDV
jgi:hypothetical protein